MLRESSQRYHRRREEEATQVQASARESVYVLIGAERVDDETEEPTGEGFLYLCQCRVLPVPLQGPQIVGRLERDFKEACLVAISWARIAVGKGLGR